MYQNNPQRHRERHEDNDERKPYERHDNDYKDRRGDWSNDEKSGKKYI